MTRLYSNNFSTALDGAITAVATSIDVADATGLPSVGGGDTCQLTLDDGGGNIEIVTCTAVSSNTLTVTRAQEGTSGYAFGDGDLVELRPTALSFIDPDGEIDFGDADSLEIPNSAAPTLNADGEIALDTTVTDFDSGVLKYYSGETMGVVAMPDAEFSSPTDGHVVSYNATNDEFELVAQSGGSGDSWGDAVDADIVPDADGTRDLGSSANRFAEVHADSIELAGTTAVTSILDEDDMTSDSATALCTQQSIKKYVDDNAGGGGGLWTLLSSSTASDTATIDFEVMTTDYSIFKLIVVNARPVAGVAVPWLRLARNGGSSYVTSNYRWAYTGVYGGGTASETGSTSDSKIVLGVAQDTDAGADWLCAEITIYGPAETHRSALTWESVQTAETDTNMYHHTGAAFDNMTDEVTGVRFMYDTGNIEVGDFYIYGLSAS